ncbi:hypothetical protein PspTeo4_02320 [Pseudomonas sp. Teo4]|nr:hypothetical protein [Pseudomonas sp. Teo4]
MVPMRGQNLDQVLPLLDYCLARGYELRFIELMRMGHLARDPNAFLQHFVGLEQLLGLIGREHIHRRLTRRWTPPRCATRSQAKAISGSSPTKACRSAGAVRVYVCRPPAGFTDACRRATVTLSATCWSSPSPGAACLAAVAGQGPGRQAGAGVFRGRHGDEGDRRLTLAQKLHPPTIRRFFVAGLWRKDA